MARHWAPSVRARAVDRGDAIHMDETGPKKGGRYMPDFEVGLPIGERTDCEPAFTFAETPSDLCRAETRLSTSATAASFRT